MKDVQEILTTTQNKSMLVIFPHPDDETVMAAGLIMRALEAGWEVEVMCLTAGEAGQIHIRGNGKSLKEIRKEEMKQAMIELGVSRFAVLDNPDGKLKTSSTWKTWFRNQIDLSKYGIVVSYGPTGVSGHPDHIATFFEIQSQISKSKVRKRPAWLWPVMVGRQKQEMVRKELVSLMPQPDWSYVLSPSHVYRKWKALKAHASQGLGKKWWIPNIILLMFFRTEYFAQWNENERYQHKYVEFEI